MFLYQSILTNIGSKRLANGKFMGYNIVINKS